MKLQQLQDFVSIAQYGSIRAAARARSASQAGLTLSLQRLEREYGVSLFERRTHGIVLTTQGERALQHAQSVLREFERADRVLREMTVEGSGAVHVGVSLDPSITMAGKVFQDFQQSYSGTELFVLNGPSDEILGALRSGQIELAVTGVPEISAMAGLTSISLYRSLSAIVCRQQHPLADVRSVEQLTNCDWVRLAGVCGFDDGAPRWQELFDIGRLPRPRSLMVFRSLFDAVGAVREADRLAILPRAIVSHWVGGRVLQAVPLELALPERDICLVHATDRPLSGRSRTLGAMLASYARLNASLAGSMEVPARPNTGDSVAQNLWRMPVTTIA